MNHVEGKRFTTIHLMNNGAQMVFEALMSKAVLTDEVFMLMAFRSKPSLTASEFAVVCERDEHEVLALLDEMCDEGFLSKDGGIYSVAPKLQDYFDTFDAAEREAFGTIFKGLIEQDAAVFDAVSERIAANCIEYIDQHPMLFSKNNKGCGCS
jgi:hypothetical protein